jgi:chorismate synthase
MPDNLVRPGHADYTGTLRYKGFNDVRGGGHFSDRLTAPLCFAGAVCAQILERRGIYTGAHILQIHNIKDNPFDPVNITRDGILSVRNKDFPVINDRKGWEMTEDINKAFEGGESLGGVIECAAVNVPAGIGSPIFDGLENNIAQLVFGIPNVRGLEFGAGFLSAKMVGSQNNDEFYVNDHGHVVTRTNNHGGIIGGISSGMPITLRVAFRPSEYVGGQQNAVNYRDMTDETAESIKHIPCNVPAAVPCVEAAVNIALLSHMMDYPNFC